MPPPGLFYVDVANHPISLIPVLFIIFFLVLSLGLKSVIFLISQDTYHLNHPLLYYV